MNKWPICQVMTFLNSLFTLFDELIDQFGVYKVCSPGSISPPYLNITHAILP